MSKKTSKQILAVLMAATLCLSTAFLPAYAALPDTGVVTPENIAIIQTQILLTKDGGNLVCYGQTSVQPSYTAGVMVELQQDTGDWTTIETWISRGGSVASVDEDWELKETGAYRLQVSHMAYNSSGILIELFTDYSSILYCG